MRSGADLKIFTTCPLATVDKARACVRHIENVARWSEEAGCEGILVSADARQLDPWLVSRAVIGATDKLCPLVTVQPTYAHPYAVAKAVASLGFMYGRRTYLNMVPGDVETDMHASQDAGAADEAQARLVEYTKVVQQLLASTEPVTHEGAFYKLNAVRMAPSVPEELRPQIFVSGFSTTARSVAAELGATPIESPLAMNDVAGPSGRQGYGVRLGIITYRDEARAWSLAQRRFPDDGKGPLAPKAVDSSWLQRVPDPADSRGRSDSYWLDPLRDGQADCPYLVGSYDQVAAELARYLDAGCTTFILDEPTDEEEMQHIGFAFELVTEHYAAA
jgi:alkanesulfonate monooxygenase